MHGVSVVMPCLNAVKYIEDSLSSICSQISDNVELIIVDGGSTDGTLDVLSDIRWPISKVISEPDNGVPDALNKGFSCASGDVLCWLNANDVYLAKNVFDVICGVFSDPAVGFAYGHSLLMDNAGIITKSSYTWPMNLKNYQKGSNVFTGSLFFSRASWSGFGGFDLRYSVAFEYQLLDYLFGNHKFVLVDAHLAAFRLHAGALSSRLYYRITDEARLLRGRVDKKDVRYHFDRFVGLLQTGLLYRVVKNKYKDDFSGTYWCDLFNRCL